MSGGVRASAPQLNESVVAAAPAANTASVVGCYAVIGAGTRVPARLVLDSTGALLNQSAERSERKVAAAPAAAAAQSVTGAVSSVDERGAVRRLDGSRWERLPDSGGVLRIVLVTAGEPEVELRLNAATLAGVMKEEGRETAISLRREGCPR